MVLETDSFQRQTFLQYCWKKQKNENENKTLVSVVLSWWTFKTTEEPQSPLSHFSYERYHPPIHAGDGHRFPELIYTQTNLAQIQ